MIESSHTSDALFESGPFPHLQKPLGLFRPVAVNVRTRAVIAVILGWVPLLALVIAQSRGNGSNLSSFITDFGVHGRSLIAAPLLILCELVCLRALEKIARHFITAGFVEDRECGRFNATVDSTRALMNSATAEIVAIISVYAIVLVLRLHLSDGVPPSWYFQDGRLSWAGWWSLFVSIPFLLILLFGWLWRILLWGRFLFRVSRLDLRLIPAHPDRAGGLRFLNSALFAFMPLAFTLGILTAGSAANRIAHQNASIQSIQTTIVGLLAAVLLLFAGPLMPFAVKMHNEKLSGIFRYGPLARKMGAQFEQKWLENYKKVTAEALEAPDFSATTDLYQVVSNVYQMALLPFELRALGALVIVSLLPFIPVVLMTIPVDVIFKEIVSLLF